MCCLDLTARIRPFRMFLNRTERQLEASVLAGVRCWEETLALSA